MSTDNLIKGLQILQPHYNKPGGLNTGAEHDVLYAYTTDKPLSASHIEQMIKAEWFQKNVKYSGDEYGKKDYDPEEGWAFYT